MENIENMEENNYYDKKPTTWHHPITKSHLNTGIDYRQHYAGLILQGLCANEAFNKKDINYQKYLPNLAVLMADELINNLNKLDVKK